MLSCLKHPHAAYGLQMIALFAPHRVWIWVILIGLEHVLFFLVLQQHEGQILIPVHCSVTVGVHLRSFVKFAYVLMLLLLSGSFSIMHAYALLF